MDTSGEGEVCEWPESGRAGGLRVSTDQSVDGVLGFSRAKRGERGPPRGQVGRSGRGGGGRQAVGCRDKGGESQQ